VAAWLSPHGLPIMAARIWEFFESSGVAVNSRDGTAQVEVSMAGGLLAASNAS